MLHYRLAGVEKTQSCSSRLCSEVEEKLRLYLNGELLLFQTVAAAGEKRDMCSRATPSCI